MHFEDLAKTREQNKKEREEAFKESERFKRVLDEDYKTWLEQSEELKSLEAEIQRLSETELEPFKFIRIKALKTQITKLKETKKKSLKTPFLRGKRL